jgi:hypothetical protein
MRLLYTLLEHSFYLFLTSEKLIFVVYSERILVPTRFLLSFMTPPIPSPASLFWEGSRFNLNL